MDQLGEGGRSIHELDKQRRRLQVIYNICQIAPNMLTDINVSYRCWSFSKYCIFLFLQVEKDELQGALEEAESALEQEENKVARAQMDIAAARADIERRLHDKEEEFEATRKNFARAIDSMSASLEGETR